jgi:hypothetical protein
MTMIRTHTLALDATDTDLSGFATSFDAAVDAACSSLESDGHEVIGIAPAAIRTIQDDSDVHNTRWHAESGMIAVITYRVGGSTQR